MAQYKSIVMGVDVGSSEICALIAGQHPETNEISLLGMGVKPSAGLRRGLVVDIDTMSHAIGETIDLAVKEAGTHPDRACVSITGEHIVSLNSTGVVGISKRGNANNGVGEITEDHRAQVLEAAKAMKLPEGREIIHTIPQQFAVDEEHGILNPLGMTGRRLEAQIHLITGSQSALRNLVHAFTWSGTKVQQFIFSALASARATLSKDERNIGVGLLDIGRDSTTCIVFSEYDVQHSNVLSIGSGAVSNDIAQLLRITYDQADELKTKYGTCWLPTSVADKLFEVKGVGGRPDENISEIKLAEFIEARMDEILNLERDRMRKSGVLKHLRSGIVITGGGARLRGLLPLAEKIFEVPVRIGTPRGISDQQNRLQDSAYCTAAGLVLSSFEESGNEGWDRRQVGKLLSRVKDFFKDNF
ncbi:MAG TPA: cell division protein FtsA [Candidatus Marinimicrobia bacterium]|nr:MAG: cell division protein FtsA [Candidatus Marinimicrobia bacterium CG1_02_48_14]PIZ64810.1 MAG: cell division protein FtsA [Candidatus Marinimicrobia bacterium CG_4_10_14_0_2_um_filter_48_9]PJA54016.1 MAG: cell division protein FtsA [Candidatus Marinimicrobia bacterium CG_4_9_14_3_um_filter_48_9]HCW76611.1 cell division protein FtsA [Candidatus Neomarinimicrobiota bacterium]